MTFLQRFALWLAGAVRLIPPIESSAVESAVDHVRHAQNKYRQESSEYRRHMAYALLTAQGLTKREASIALEIAIGLAK